MDRVPNAASLHHSHILGGQAWQQPPRALDGLLLVLGPRSHFPIWTRFWLHPDPSQ